MLRICDIHHQEGQKEHSFIPALQITEDILCLARVGRQIGRDDIHIEPFTGGALLGVDLHAVQIRDLSFDRLDRLILVHAADMKAHQDGTVRIQQVRQKAVVHFRGRDL